MKDTVLSVYHWLRKDILAVALLVVGVALTVAVVRSTNSLSSAYTLLTTRSERLDLPRLQPLAGLPGAAQDQRLRQIQESLDRIEQALDIRAARR